MLNVANRTLFADDNLVVMRGINSECIDLIYLDPPFPSP
jgi:site-specific DNA-methyltransferase (adenine-specific)